MKPANVLVSVQRVLPNGSSVQICEGALISNQQFLTAAHCFEAKCFAVMCAGYMDKAMRETVVSHNHSAAETLDSLTQGQSCFLDPTGAQIGESVQGEEGIAYAELDLTQCVEPKQFHDTVGYYQRFDIFDLKVDRRRQGVEDMFIDDVDDVSTEKKQEDEGSTKAKTGEDSA